MLQYFGLAGTYCPAPREWCSTLRRCLDPSNPDTPCESAPATSPYSTTTTQTTKYIRPAGREEVRGDAEAAEDLAVLAQRKLDALGIDCDNCCRSYTTCPIGLKCYNDVSCNYGGTEHDAGAIMSSHDVTLVEEARGEGIVVERFPATTSGSPAGNYPAVVESELEPPPEPQYIPSPSTGTLPNHPEETILPDTREERGVKDIGQFFSQSFEIGGMSVPIWGLGVAAFGALLLFKR